MRSTPQTVPSDARASALKRKLLFYALVLAYALAALVVRLVAFLPLYALYAFPADSPWRWLALLCPLLLVFVVLPLRFSFAKALARPDGARTFSFADAFSFDGYGEKLSESAWHALHVLVWSLPLLAALAYGYFYQSNNDALTLLNAVRSLGATVVSLGCAVANFFTTLFGGGVLTPTGGLMEGFYTLFAIVGLCVLILLFGAMRNSAFRYIWVTATREEKDAHIKARRALRGRRLRQLGVAAVDLVLWLPFLLVILSVARRAFSDVSTLFATVMMSGSIDTAGLSALLKPVLIAFFALYLPLLPVRRIITARFAASCHAGRPSAKATTPEGGAPENMDWLNSVPTTSSGSPAPESTESQTQA